MPPKKGKKKGGKKKEKAPAALPPPPPRRVMVVPPQTAYSLYEYGVLVFGQKEAIGLADSDMQQAFVPRFLNHSTAIHVMAADAGRKFSALVDHAGYVFVFGDNSYGALGLGPLISTVSTPLVIPGVSDIAGVSCGWEHMLLTTRRGTVLASGSSMQHQLGFGVPKQVFVFEQLHRLEQPQQQPGRSAFIVQAAASSDFSLFVDKWGVVRGCGNGLKDMMAVPGGVDCDFMTPTRIRGFKSSFTADQIRLFLRDKVCADLDYYLQFVPERKEVSQEERERIAIEEESYSAEEKAAAEASRYMSPEQTLEWRKQIAIDHWLAILDGDVPIASVSCSHRHVLACSISGEVFSFGEGMFGKLGHGGPENSPTPKLIEGLVGKKVVQVSAGFDHSLVLDASGNVYSCGSGVCGCLGNKKDQRIFVPTMVDLRDIVTGLKPTKEDLKRQALGEKSRAPKITWIAAGHDYSMLVDENHKVIVFGSPADGRCGTPILNNGKYEGGIYHPEYLPLLYGRHVSRVYCKEAHNLVIVEPPALPASPKAWNENDVAVWLESVGLRSEVDAFKAAQINGELLLQLDHQTLMEKLFMNMQQRNDLLFKLKTLAAKSV
eukprot:ANDGO_02931.mRNA.1 putative E3 ubiquitin-protein ligase HERC2